MDSDTNEHRNSNTNKIFEHHEGNNTTGSEFILCDGQDHTENIIDETTTNLSNKHQPQDRGIDEEDYSAETPDEFTQSESINKKRENIFEPNSITAYRLGNVEMYDGNTSEEQHPQNNLPTPFVEWIYPPRDETNPNNNSLNLEHFVDPSDAVIVPSVIDGVIMQNKRCFFKICGMILCDDSFPYAINSRIFPFLIAFVITMIAVSTTISIYMTGPSENDLHPVSVDLNPSQTPTNVASISPSLDPSMSPSSQCLVKSPYLNESLIGNGICDGGKYFDEKCGFDGGDCIPSLDLVGKAYGGGRKWSDFILGPDGNIYGMPATFGNILKFDPSRNKTSLIVNDLDNFNWISGVLGSDGIIYGVPYNAKSVLKYDPILSSISFIGEDNQLLLNGNAMFRAGVRVQNGNIYFIPYNHNKVMVLNSSNLEEPLVEIGDDLGWGRSKFRSGVLGQDGNIYCIPYHASKVLKISVSDDTISFIGADMNGQEKWANGVLSRNGNIYTCPFSVNHVLKINTTDQTTSLVGPMLQHNNQAWFGFVEGPDGLLYGIPLDSDKLFIFDPIMETATMIPLDDELIGEAKWAVGVLANNGIIYAVPFHTQNRILAIKPHVKR